MSQHSEMSGRWAVEPPARPCLPITGHQALYPVHRIYCVGKNYAEHAREMGSSGREKPCFFAKPADAVTTSAEVPFPRMTENLHHEAELVVAMGKACRNIPANEALAHVFGYAAGVDLTRRDLQTEAKGQGRPWTTAKGFDHSAPISPIRSVEEGGHPHDAAVSLSVNGEIRQQASTADMTWSVAEVIAELSRYFDLQPGDLIFTGTPAGVGPLQAGDRVECRIEGVGELDFRIVP
jgi:fumarylpyruvate hydrolase